jgi:hypothetical protein
MNLLPRLMKTKSRRTLIYIAALAAFFCFAAMQISAQPQISNVATFLYFSIDEATPNPVVKLTDSRRVEGTFKNLVTETPREYESGLVVVRVQDKDGKSLYETQLLNPLDQHLEYVNDKGELDHARVQQQHGTFEVRVPFDTAGRTVYIYVVDENHRLNLLLTL